MDVREAAEGGEGEEKERKEKMWTGVKNRETSQGEWRRQSRSRRRPRERRRKRTCLDMDDLRHTFHFPGDSLP
jgi:hypothetical protein